MLRFLGVLAASSLVLLGAGPGCGGGSGTENGPGPSPAPLTTFVGAYRILSLSATSGLPLADEAQAAVSVGTARSDGRGVLEMTTDTYTTDLGHAIPLPGPSTSTVTYAETSSRVLTLSAMVGGTEELLASGYVSADGEVALLAMATENRVPGLIVLTRSVTSATAEDFFGKYFSLTWAVDYDATSRGAAIGGATFELPSAAFDTISTSNTDGVAWSGSLDLTGTWSWAADGTFDIYYSGSVYDFEGGLGCSDPVILCGGSFTTADGPGIRTYVPVSAGRTLADFAGTHYAVGLIWRPSDGHYVGFWGSLTPDGSGNVTRSFRTNDEGVIGLATPVTSTYELNTGGLLTVGLGPYGRCLGGLSTTGHLAFLGGGSNAGDPVSVVVVMRR